MAKLRDVCFVHLGKFGDIALMLPAFKAVADEMGKPPVCVVSSTYASILEGVSYVVPWVMPLHWWGGVGKAKQTAISAGFDPVVVKWWDEPGAQPPIQLGNAKTITLKIHGKLRRIPAQEWDSFQASQWRYAGFTMEQMMEWPLIFDRRDRRREEELRLRSFRSARPKLLINASQSGTSPFKFAPQLMALTLGLGCEIVNLANVKAHRIYDLLGLYDHAAGLVTTDTATLHLAAASTVPYIAFINDGGSGSIPKGNCVLTVRYSQFQQNMGWIVDTLKKFARKEAVFA